MMSLNKRYTKWIRGIYPPWFQSPQSMYPSIFSDVKIVKITMLQNGESVNFIKISLICTIMLLIQMIGLKQSVIIGIF